MLIATIPLVICILGLVFFYASAPGSKNERVAYAMFCAGLLVALWMLAPEGAKRILP
jgi:hypothetical protein